MKVKEFAKKVNAASAKLPVYIQNGIAGDQRALTGPDFNGYYFPEEDKTVCSISIEADKIIVYYK